MQLFCIKNIIYFSVILNSHHPFPSTIIEMLPTASPPVDVLISITPSTFPLPRAKIIFMFSAWENVAPPATVRWQHIRTGYIPMD